MSAELKEKLLQVKGVSEVNISRQDYQRISVDFDREKLALHGIESFYCSNYLRNRVNGALASYYREDGDEYDIRVRYAPEFRTKIEDLENILIYTPSGEGIRVKDLGKVVERSAPPTIERKDRERIVTVSAVISGAPLGDVVADGNAIIDKMDLPSGVSIQISGSYEDQQDSFSDLGTLAVLIVILVFIVMAAQFESLSYPFIIMFSIPFAFSGVLMALFFTGTNFECDVAFGWNHVDWYCGEERYRTHRLHHALPRTWSSGASLCSHGRPQPFASGINDYTDHYPRYGADGCRQGEGARCGVRWVLP